MGRNNYPNQSIDKDLPKEFIAPTIDSLSALAAKGRISGKAADDEQFRERCAEFIQFCRDHSLRPAIESACLAFGITRQTLHRWSVADGCGAQRQQDVLQFKQMIFAFLEQSALSGKLNPVNYVWLSKNWMNYQDQIRIDTDEQSIHSYVQRTPEEIAARYAGTPKPELPQFDDD